VVHRIVLNLVIRYKSTEENFVTPIHHSQATTTLTDKMRRLSLQFGNAEDAIPPTNMRLSQVRTVAFWGVLKCLPTVVQFTLLQVLILHFWGDKDSINFDLNRISELFRLRYLKVTSNVTLELGNQMRGLHTLETLTKMHELMQFHQTLFTCQDCCILVFPQRQTCPMGLAT
jgi:hypothetical protein